MAFKHNDSCLAKGADDEPIFVLRAQDLLAPAIVEFWCVAARAQGCSERRIEEARSTAEQMRAWAREHGGGKFPD